MNPKEMYWTREEVEDLSNQDQKRIKDVHQKIRKELSRQGCSLEEKRKETLEHISKELLGLPIRTLSKLVEEEKNLFCPIPKIDIGITQESNIHRDIRKPGLKKQSFTSPGSGMSANDPIILTSCSPPESSSSNSKRMSKANRSLHDECKKSSNQILKKVQENPDDARCAKKIEETSKDSSTSKLKTEEKKENTTLNKNSQPPQNKPERGKRLFSKTRKDKGNQRTLLSKRVPKSKKPKKATRLKK